MEKLKVAVVTPVFNEEEVIGYFHKRARLVLDSMPDVEATLVFVLDRCTDNSLVVLREIVKGDPKSKLIALSSRFGHQMSLVAGIEKSRDADAIIMMDSDLQHPPELIPAMISAYRNGFDVVYTTRQENEGSGALRSMAGNGFYKFLSRISDVPITANAADFRLVSNRVARVLIDGFREQNVFLRGIIPWVGFNQIGLEYVAEPRFAGKSKYSLSRMLRLAADGILSFSTKPLQVGIFVGVGFACMAFLFAFYAIVNYFVARSVPSGWTTIAVLLMLFSGVQLIVVGILGSYIGGIYQEVKNRPRYIIEEELSHDQTC
ncbi:glycosyltransferase family 2 protein [Paraburkholderia sp. Cy-641]|uniref:glycosyltransferase family 2 protein n=1 Tax=Paraburkholderia sp. Cy-641 TaxID=2608337 RepID=UPI0014244D55|nr:glycosyltransferase family 2 protein [Paraburkholderia sp. Cy-641]NIF76622.1 glycosyltransferase family 2 protein [Paraburkholderia sp. Cy-641]